MQNVQSQEQILKDYEKQGNEIITQMLNVLIRAQRKTDDVSYRKILEKLQEEEF